MATGRRTRRAELEALTTIAALVNCTHELDEILRGALQATLDVVGVDAGEVFLIDEDSGDLILHAHRGLSEAFVRDEAQIGPGDCLCGVSAGSEQMLVALDLRTHPARTRPTCLREGFCSLLCLPLRARGQGLGLLNVQSRSPRTFTAADQELLAAIGNQIGIAIANARLIADAEQRRATLDGVMNSLADGLILLDRRGKVAYTNACADEILGLPAHGPADKTPEAVDAQVTRFLDELSLDSPVTDGQAHEAQKVPRMEITLEAPTPRTIQVRRFQICNDLDEPLGLGLLLRDITQEKELDRMKSQLLATVSHELRTPLASIKGFATTLLRKDVEWDAASRLEFLSIIDGEADRLSELIDNLLDMSRVEAGTLRVKREAVALGPLVQETAGELRLLTQMHEITVAVAEAMRPVWADPRRIRQVLRNLVENAVKYSPMGGPICISATERDGEVVVSVADQGVGIAAENLEQVFSRFYQVDSASTRRAGGAGLGLAICKAIIEAHDGRIWAESRLGEGSTFSFALPSVTSAAGSEG